MSDKYHSKPNAGVDRDLEEQRKLVKQKLQRRIREDLADQAYGARRRNNCSNTAGILVLCVVVAFGLLEFDMEMPLLNQASEQYHDLFKPPIPAVLPVAQPQNASATDLVAYATTADPQYVQEEAEAAAAPTEAAAFFPTPAAAVEFPASKGENDQGETPSADAAATAELSAGFALQGEWKEEVNTPPPDVAEAEAVEVTAAPVEDAGPSVAIDFTNEVRNTAEAEAEAVPEEVAQEVAASEATTTEALPASEAEANNPNAPLPFDDGALIPTDEVRKSKSGSSKKGSAKATRPIEFKEFPACRPVKVTKSDSEMDFLTQKMQGARALVKPFPAVFLCGFWPDGLYTRMLLNFPPKAIFDRITAESKDAAARKCDTRVCHRVIKVSELLNAPNSTLKEWKNAGKAKHLFERVEKMVFSKDFETALFEKLGLKRLSKMKREMYFNSDTSGYTKDSMKVDSAKKLITMQIHLAVTPKVEHDYGMCLHTADQYKARKIPMGGSSEDEKEADCEVKFRFLPNSVVAIKTSPTSYHSVPNSNIKHMAGLDRNILTVEWYKTS